MDVSSIAAVDLLAIPDDQPWVAARPVQPATWAWVHACATALTAALLDTPVPALLADPAQAGYDAGSRAVDDLVADLGFDWVHETGWSMPLRQRLPEEDLLVTIERDVETNVRVWCQDIGSAWTVQQLMNGHVDTLVPLPAPVAAVVRAHDATWSGTLHDLLAKASDGR
jgi:hypothetical protein